MQLAVISDLHLGTGDPSDSFGHDDATFLTFLKQLESDFERIVLLGDIWETLTTPMLFDASAGLRAAREAHSEIARRLLSPQYMYIHGNHDLVAGAVDNAPSEWTLDTDGVRLVFTHGHHHDWLIRRARWLSESLVWLGGWARRLGMATLYQLGYWLDAWMSKTGEHPSLDSFQAWTLAVARQRKADVIVTGHTHVASSVEQFGRLSLNSGCCSEGHLSYLAIDTKRDCYDLYQSR